MSTRVLLYIPTLHSITPILLRSHHCYCRRAHAIITELLHKISLSTHLAFFRVAFIFNSLSSRASSYYCCCFFLVQLNLKIMFSSNWQWLHFESAAGAHFPWQPVCRLEPILIYPVWRSTRSGFVSSWYNKLGKSQQNLYSLHSKFIYLVWRSARSDSMLLWYNKLGKSHRFFFSQNSHRSLLLLFLIWKAL